MSWKRKKKKIDKVKHKTIAITCLMFAVVLGLVIFLLFRLIKNNNNYYSIEPRTKELEKVKPFKDSNYKAIGWLRVQGTNLDLPIVYSENKYEEFPVELENFVWSRNRDTKFTNYVDITGHNIFNLSANPKIKSDSFSRFEELMAFVYYDFAKDNEYIQLTLDGKEYLYKIFMVGFVNKSDETFFPKNDEVSKDDLKKQLEWLEKDNIYKYNIDVNENDKLIALSTCTRFYGEKQQVSFYVVGRLLRDGEKINHYKVTKSSKYKNIEKILKGDENNEKDNV